MFNDKKDSPIPAIDNTPQLLSINHTLDDISRKLTPPKARAPHMETVTFDSSLYSYQTLTDKGFPYVGMYVAQAQQLTVTLFGVVTTLILAAGYNRLNIPYGALLSTATGFSGVMIWSDIPFVDDLPGVQLIGWNGKVGQDSNKNLLVGIRSSAGYEPIISPYYGGNDATINSDASLLVSSESRLFNEGSWDRQRNNTQGTLLASAARTAAVNTANQTNYNARGVQLILNVTAASGTGGIKINIAGLAVTSYWMNASPTYVTAPGKYVYELYPGIGATSGDVTQRTSGILPRSWRVEVTVGDASSYTYQLDYALIL